MAEKNYQSNEQKNKQTNYTGSNQTKTIQVTVQTVTKTPLREDRLAVLFLCNKPSSRKQSQTQIRTLRISY